MPLGSLTGSVEAATTEALTVVPRIWERDHTVWGPDPTELADRLGWLDADERAEEVRSRLEAQAAEGFREVIHGQADVGGRFSALGAVMAAAVRDGRDKLTLLLPDEVASFGLWIEQLVAESMGKHGVGLLPIVGEDPTNATFGDDRIVISLGRSDHLETLIATGVPVVELPWSGPAQLSGEVIRWEFATAVAGALLGINPFDQPDVEAAKKATSEVLDAGEDLPDPEDPAVVLGSVNPGDYIALLAFVTPEGDDHRAVDAAAARLRRDLGVPVTVGVGPRYLHSTGPLHKGGRNTGGFLVVVGDDPQDADIPGRDLTELSPSAGS